MAGITSWPSWRRRCLAVLTISLTAVALTACGETADTPPAPGATGDTQIGGAPPATFTTPAAKPTTQATNTGNTASNAPFYPKDAKAYAQELLRAWAGPDYGRLGQLAIQSAVQQIRDSVNFGGKPNSQWTHISCGPGDQTGFTNCLFRNAHGDESVIKLTNTQLGFPTAVTEAQLMRTQYPASPVDYVNSLLDAYREGNQQRVLRLSNSGVRDKIKCTFGSQATVTVTDGTYSKVRLDGLGVDLGKSYEFRVLSQPGGKAGAVKEVLTSSC